ncbi:MAG TPA: hypothetical protein VHG89_13680 [Verrucomicrobiae bacterium]|nr:hypothetical protein [Verrucomicrobiae bacterium]
MNLEEKIEYQLSPEMAEELAIEQLKISSQNSNLRQWFVPIFLGMIFAFLFARSSDYSPNFKGVLRVTGFCLGFGCGWASIIESKKRIRKDARAMQQKGGATRMISWDSEALMIQSAISESKIKWQAIDKIKNGRVGVYLFVGGKIYFGLHKRGLPQNVFAEELIKAWRQPIPVV